MTPVTPEEVWPVTTATDADAGGRGRVLVVVRSGADNLGAVSVGVALAAGTGTDLVFVQPELYPVQTPLELPPGTLESAKRHLAGVVDAVRDEGHDGSLSAVVRAGRSLDAVLRSAAVDHDADFVVLGSDTPSLNDVVDAIECDVVSARPLALSERTQSVLVPVAGGPHSRLAALVGAAIAECHGGWVELLHVLDPAASAADRETAEELLSTLAASLDDVESVDTWLLEAASVTDVIAEQSRYYDCTVVGAPTKGVLARFAYGSTSEELRSEATGPVLTVWDRARHRRRLSRIPSKQKSSFK